MSKEAAMAIATGQPVPAPVVDSAIQPIPNEPAAEPKGLDSDRFAKLAAREEKLQRAAQEYKSEQQKLYEEKEKLKSVQSQISEFEKLRETDPVAALKVLGFTDAQIANALIPEPKEAPTPEEIARKAAQEQLEAYKKEQQEIAAKAEAEKNTRLIGEFKQQIGKFVEKDAEKYEFCNHYGPVAQEAIYETVLEFIKQDPNLTPIDAMREAVEALEAYYESEDEALMNLRKRQAKITKTAAPAPEPAKPVQRSRTPQAAKPVPTLTNKATATVASTAPVKESREQKRARLEAMLRGDIK